jgi:predicted hotdog family 3-hydroxylacyl-ACP dehydratase
MAVDARIAGLIPHAGAMCLLERIERWDESSVTLATSTHRDPANPLADRSGLRSIHLCEYGAQAMAVHGGLMAQADGRRASPGLLVSLRDVELHRDFVHDLDGELHVEARRIQASESAWQYSFRVVHAGTLLAQGRATVSAASGS